jgi:hypothetical protein
VALATLDQVSARAQAYRRVHLGRALLTALAAVLVGIGWAAGRLVTGLVVAVTWSAAAVAVGWTAGRPRAVGGDGG